MSLVAVPLTLAQANTLVASWHRHHKPAVGHRFSIGAFDVKLDGFVGAVVVGRPVARLTPQHLFAEVTRLVTNGHKNACSYLYASAARAADAMGYWKIQTFILDSEPGTSLRDAGWEFEAVTDGGDWNSPTRKGRRTDQPQCPKQRWSKVLSSGHTAVRDALV